MTRMAFSWESVCVTTNIIPVKEKAILQLLENVPMIFRTAA